MNRSAVEKLIEAVKESQADYPAVMMRKEDWAEVLKEIDDLGWTKVSLETEVFWLKEQLAKLSKVSLEQTLAV